MKKIINADERYGFYYAFITILIILPIKFELILELDHL